MCPVNMERALERETGRSDGGTSTNHFKLSSPQDYNNTHFPAMVLEFSLSPDATGRVYELLACLAKFGDTVSIEARAEKASPTDHSSETK